VKVKLIRPAGQVGVKGTITKTKPGGEKEVLHESGNTKVVHVPPSQVFDFPPNAPRVGAQIGMTLSEKGTYCSVHAQAWCELPVPGFDKDMLAKVHNRAFEICEDKVMEKMTGLKALLKSL